MKHKKKEMELRLLDFEEGELPDDDRDDLFLNDQYISSLEMSLQFITKYISSYSSSFTSSPLFQKAVNLIRNKLVELGYLNVEGIHSDDGKEIKLRILAPIRQESAAAIKNHLNLRKQYAKKQKRELFPNEQKEILQGESTLAQFQTTNHRTLDNPSDSEWYNYDLKKIQCWMLSLDESEIGPQPNARNEKDPYFYSHIHFLELGDEFSVSITAGSFWIDLYQSHLKDS